MDLEFLFLYYLVTVPPTIMPFNWPQFVTGHRAVLSCTVQTGDLPITITWHWNGKELTNSVGMSIHQLEFSSSVSFRSVTTDHRGRYNCVAENRAGKASQSAEFIVLGMLQLFIYSHRRYIERGFISL